MPIDYQHLASKHGFSEAAVRHLAEAMQRGNGTQAQFNHPEFGGMGQWMPTMLMIGDAFNHALKAKVDALCNDLAAAYRAGDMPKAATTMPQTKQWWDESLGKPAMVGEQNAMRYAVFADKKRLVVAQGDSQTVYDTGEHHITGVSQGQSNSTQMLVFTTRTGTIALDDLTQL